MSSPSAVRIPAPTIAPENQPYWDAATAEKLLIKRCRTCTRLHGYPRGVCPACLSMDTEWVEARGTGVVYSYTVIGTGTGPALIPAYVQLDEGITMLSNLLCTPEQARIGSLVTVTFVAAENGQKVPMFRLCEERT